MSKIIATLAAALANFESSRAGSRLPWAERPAAFAKEAAASFALASSLESACREFCAELPRDVAEALASAVPVVPATREQRASARTFLGLTNAHGGVYRGCGAYGWHLTVPAACRDAAQALAGDNGFASTLPEVETGLPWAVSHEESGSEAGCPIRAAALMGHPPSAAIVAAAEAAAIVAAAAAEAAATAEKEAALSPEDRVESALERQSAGTPQVGDEAMLHAWDHTADMWPSHAILKPWGWAWQESRLTMRGWHRLCAVELCRLAEAKSAARRWEAAAAFYLKMPQSAPLRRQWMRAHPRPAAGM